MKTNYIFDVNDTIKIVVSVGPCELDPRCVCEANMFLHFEENLYELGMVDLSLAIECIKECMVNALHNVFIDKSLVNTDIGFLFNQYLYESCQERRVFPQTQIIYNSDEEWIGAKYKAWGGYGVSTWLYTSLDGSIVFEAAPVYPEDFSSDDFDHQKFYAWMKAYKPLFIRKISQEKLQEWIKTADQLLRDVTWMDREGVESA